MNAVAVASPRFVRIFYWPGGGLGVARKKGFACAFVLCLLAASAAGATNEWTKPTSGYWEEPYWSLERLPTNQDMVLFDNSGFKALAIGYSTVTNAPQSLSIQSLMIEAPTNSFNQLLLNWAGFTVPLSVSSNLVIGTNGSLVSHSSALIASDFYISATAQFFDESTASFTNVFVGPNSGSELDLSNSVFAADLFQLGALQSQSSGLANQSGGTNQVGTLAIYPGSGYMLADGGVLNGNALEMHTISFGSLDASHFTQTGGNANFGSAGNVLGSEPNTFARLSLSGGSFQATNLSLNNGSFVQTGGTILVSLLQLSPNVFTSGSYTLSDGLLVSGNLTAGMGAGNTPPPAVFTQTGGVHTNGSLTLVGTIRGFALAFGRYYLDGGVLVSGSEGINMGSMTQDAGTNFVDNLSVAGGGSYYLAGGQIVSSNVSLSTVEVETIFSHTGGDHRILGLLSLNRLVTYSLGAGTLEVSNIEVDPGGQLLVQGGTVTNSGLCTINAGLVTVGTTELQLGQLCVTGSSNTIFSSRPTYSTLAFLPVATTVRFRDSHDILWNPPGLFIQDWNYTNGPDHIFVGTNSQGLTAQQVSLVTFSNPGGLPSGNYPAMILPTGELVPSTGAPTLGFTTQPGRLVLSWSGPSQLYTSTNVTGPYTPLSGSSSPYINTFLDPQRFFRLQSQ